MWLHNRVMPEWRSVPVTTRVAAFVVDLYGVGMGVSAGLVVFGAVQALTERDPESSGPLTLAVVGTGVALAALALFALAARVRRGSRVWTLVTAGLLILSVPVEVATRVTDVGRWTAAVMPGIALGCLLSPSARRHVRGAAPSAKPS